MHVFSTPAVYTCAGSMCAACMHNSVHNYGCMQNKCIIHTCAGNVCNMHSINDLCHTEKRNVQCGFRNDGQDVWRAKPCLSMPTPTCRVEGLILTGLDKFSNTGFTCGARSNGIFGICGGGFSDFDKARLCLHHDLRPVGQNWC